MKHYLCNECNESFTLLPRERVRCPWCGGKDLTQLEYDTDQHSFRNSPNLIGVKEGGKDGSSG